MCMSHFYLSENVRKEVFPGDSAVIIQIGGDAPFLLYWFLPEINESHHYRKSAHELCCLIWPHKK